MYAALSHRCRGVWAPVFALLVINAAVGLARASSYPFSTFHRLQGAIVYEVHEDYKGGIWLGTESGVWRWRNNGFEMVNSPTGTTAQTPVPAGWGRGALTIASDSKSNTLWIGTGSGLLALNMESLEPNPVPGELKRVTINRLRVMPRGDVWAGTKNGLFKLQTRGKHAEAVLVPETDSLNVEDFVQAGQTLWVGTDQELLEINHGKIRKHFEKEITGRAMHLHYASDGAMWMGLRRDPGLYRWDASGVRKFGAADGLKNDEVNSIVERGNGEIWIGTERGVFRWIDGAFQCIDQDSGLTQTDVHSIVIDRDDEIWIGTFGGGVCLLRSPDVVTYGPEDGLINPFVTVMCRTANDTILAGSLQGFSFFNLETESGRASEAIDHVTAAALDREGRIWLGGECVALCLETGKKLTLPHAVKSFAFDTLGQMFIGCSHGLFVAQNDELRKIQLSDSLEMAANAILVEKDNSLIVGTGKGVYFGIEGQWRLSPTDSPVLSLAQSSTGDLWVGTHRSLTLISKSTHEVIENYADIGRAYCILPQSDGVTWCGTEDGLLKIHDQKAHCMTMANGLSSTDVRCLVGLNNGVLYAGTTGGLSRIATDRWKCATQPPRIDLELWSMGESLVRGAQTRLAMPLNDQGLVADILTMGQRNRVGMSFQYRIQEAIDDWSDWSAQQRIILPELDAGQYTLHVRGRNAAGLISNEAVKEFEILAPLWQTPAFIASSGSGAFLALFAGAYVARRRIHYRRRIERSERKYRTLVESIRVIPYQAEAHSGEFRYVGPQASKLTGHEMSAWMGPSVWNRVIAQDDEPAVRSLWNHAASNGGHCVAEHRLNSENGEIRWVRNIAAAASESNHKLISGLMIDITAEKRAEAGDKELRAELESAVAARTAELTAANESLRKEIEERCRVESALRDSEERFSKLFNRSPVAMVLSTLQDGIVLNANDAHLHMSGFSREELIGRPIAEFNTWADMADRVRFVEQLRRDGSVSGFNASFYTKDRRLRVGRVAAECIEHNGQMCLLSAALDITETHQIEMELEKQRQFLKQLINLNPHLIFAKDADGRFTLVNETIAEVYGTTIENLTGKTDADFNQNTEEVAFFRSIDREVMRSGQEHRVEEVITDSTGKIRHLDTIKIPLNDENGNAFGILGVATDITLRKRAEEALRIANDQLELRVQERTASLREAERRARESKELLHHMTDAIPGAVYKFRRTKDGVQSFDFISRGIEEIFEVTAEQMKEDFNLAWAPIIEEDEPDMAESIRVSAATLQPWSMDFRIRTPSGRIKWLSGRSRPEPPDADGTIVWNGILTDISEKKRVEQALRDSMDRFSLVARGATDGIWEMTMTPDVHWSSSQTKVYHAPRVKELLGYDDHEEMGTVEAWTSRLHPDDAERAYKAVKDHLERRVPYQVEYRLRTKSGQYRWFMDRGQAAWDELDRPRRMAGSITDITRRKEAEERLRRQALVFDNMYDGVLLTDLAGRIMDWNTGAERIFGYSREEMLGQSPEMLNPPEAAAALTSSIQSALAVEGRWTGEVRIVRKDGTEGVCESFLVQLQDEDGQRIGTVAVNRDITDRKKAEREKAILAEQLVQSAKMEAIGTLASGIAHQFDNLLTAISAYTDMAKTTLPSTHQAVRSLEKVEMTSRHARVVTNGLLDFSRPSSGRQSTLDLSQVVLDTVQMLDRVLDSRIEIDAKSVAQEQTWIRGNPTHLQQVLVNLAVNAQDAMPNGGRLRISLTNRTHELGPQSKGHAVLVVSDTGTGIAPQHLPRIFEPFFTTKPRGRGTGLGLPIIHRIVTDMGGKIQVESEPGTGATMTITMPCCDAPTGAMQEDMRLPARKSQGHVIIIESNPHVRSIMTTTLRGVGCEVRPVSRVDEALDFVAKRPTQSNLIVMDLDSVTPKDFAKLTSLREQRADMRMIVIVGTLSIDLKRHRLDDCLLLRKPFDMPELTELVEDCLNSLSNQEGGNNGE